MSCCVRVPLFNYQLVSEAACTCRQTVEMGKSRFEVTRIDSTSGFLHIIESGLFVLHAYKLIKSRK